MNSPKLFRIAFMLTAILTAQTLATVVHAGNMIPPLPVFDASKDQQKSKPAYPGNYQLAGIVRNVKGGEHSITISGTKYYYGINTRVRTPQSDFSSVQSLAIGTRVGVNFTTDEKNRRLLYEIWVLSSDMVITAPSDL